MKKLKFTLFKKYNQRTIKLNAVNNQWLVVKTISQKETHKLPLCLLEIKELKQFLNENYPEL